MTLTMGLCWGAYPQIHNGESTRNPWDEGVLQRGKPPCHLMESLRHELGKSRVAGGNVRFRGLGYFMYPRRLETLSGISLCSCRGSHGGYGGSEARGSSLIVLSQRMARYFRGHSVGETCTGVFLELTPPVRCVSWHAPTGAYDCETYAQSVHEVERCLDELALLGGDSVIVMGADANCQLNTRDHCVGPLAAGERFNEHERAELLYGFLAQRVLRAASTYNRGGPTRLV